MTIVRPPRRIAHLDMDAFFASVELLAYPELRGLPVVVGGAKIASPGKTPDGQHKFARLKDYGGRGVVTTSTYEARKLGVFSGMGLMRSAQFAPEAILLPARFEAYRDTSRRFKRVVAQIAPVIEDRGIDEIYIDLTELEEATLPLARRLKAAVFAATSLTCSIGIAPNKLLAKIGSDLQKPDGVTTLFPEDVPSRIWPLDVKKINGIGEKTAAHLEKLGIRTIGELAQTPVETLTQGFGPRIGAWLSCAANGIDDSPVVTWRAPKSLSRETTFERDLHVRHDHVELSAQLVALCARLAEDLEKRGYAGNTIGVKLRFADFRRVTREITWPQAMCAAEDLLHAVRQCLKHKLFADADQYRIRLLGVRCGNLVARDQAKVRAAPELEPHQGELPF
ncbi:MAG: DNA polymerase IV [Zoogloeaceae bacterium]|jgi:DNA polymerase-4|nr:DNA polymerase IV [Zoogloeaceae bacterium]